MIIAIYIYTSLYSYFLGVSPTSSIIALSKQANMINSGNVSTIQSESEMDSKAVQKLKNIFAKQNHYVAIIQNYIGLLEKDEKADATVLARIKQVAKDIATIKDDALIILTEDFHAPLANREVEHQSNKQPPTIYRSGRIRPLQYQSQRSLQIQRYIRLQPLSKLLSARKFPREEKLEPLPSYYTFEDLCRSSAISANNLPWVSTLSQKMEIAQQTLHNLQNALARWILTENQIKEIVQLMNYVLEAKQREIQLFHIGLGRKRK